MGLRLHVWSHPSIVDTVGQQLVCTEYPTYLDACFSVGQDLDYQSGSLSSSLSHCLAWE